MIAEAQIITQLFLQQISKYIKETKPLVLQGINYFGLL